MLVVPEGTMQSPLHALAGLSLSLAMPAAPPQSSGTPPQDEPTTTTTTTTSKAKTPPERARLLTSRNPASNAKRPRRTHSLSSWTPHTRDARADISRLTGSARTPSPPFQHDRGPVARLPPPLHDITLRHVRRRDAPRVQALLTQDTVDNLTVHEIRRAGDFGAALEYVEDIVDEEAWLDVEARGDHDEDEGVESSPDSSSSSDDDDDDDEDSPPKKHPTALAIAHDDALIGVIAVYNGNTRSFRDAELTYWLGPPHRGRGIMRAALPLFLDWLFTALPRINRVDAGVYRAWAPASERVLRGAGFAFEGAYRDGHFRPGVGFSDTGLWGLLRSEWVARPRAEGEVLTRYQTARLVGSGAEG